MILRRIVSERMEMRIELTEGRDRQIRRLREAAGLTGANLRRVEIDTPTLDGLTSGAWRHVPAQVLTAGTASPQA